MIAISLASFAIPLSLGVLFKYKRPEKADRLAFVLSRPFFLLCLLLIPALAMSQSTFVFYLLTWRHALSGFLVGESQALFLSTYTRFDTNIHEECADFGRVVETTKSSLARSTFIKAQNLCI